MNRILFVILLCINWANALAQNIAFSENKNQWPEQVQFRTRIGTNTIYFEKTGILFDLLKEEDVKHSHAHHHETCEEHNCDNKIIHGHVYKVFFKNINSECVATAEKEYSDYENYYLGKDQSKWSSNVKRFGEITYNNIWEGVDLKYYSTYSGLKYDFIIRPGADYQNIKLEYKYTDKLSIKDGLLYVKTSINTVIEHKPIAYQLIKGKKVDVPCGYVLNKNEVSFDFPKGYNKDYEVVIDPELIFSTYTGSTTDNWGFTATPDIEGNIFSGGISLGGGYPTSTGAYQITNGGNWDVGLIKYSEDGTTRIYATYLGGASTELPHSLIVNEYNDLIVLGTTGSSNFPVSSNAYDATFNGGDTLIYDHVLNFYDGIDIYVTRFSADGSNLIGSTYVGGSKNDGLNFKPYMNGAYNVIMHGNDSLFYNYADGARGEIITDAKNNIYVGSCTFSNDFPVAGNAFQSQNAGEQEGVIFKLKDDLSSLLFSNYIGGSGDDAIYSVDVDDNYDVYVAGGTASTDFPTTAGAYNVGFNGGTTDGFVSKISATGNQLMASSYFGSGDYDQSYFVRVDRANKVYITGQTKASGSTLIYNAPYNIPNSGQFITKFNNSLTEREWSTVFGTGNGRPNISITAFSVDICNRIYLSGWGREWGNYSDNGNTYTWGTSFGTVGMEVTSDAHQDTTDGQDFYVMVLTEDASALEYATFFGEYHYDDCSYSGHDHVDGGTSRFDKRGRICQSVCASCGSCNEFPTFPDPGVWSPGNGAAPMNNNCNNAVFLFSFMEDIAVADFVLPPTSCAPYEVDFDNQSAGQDFIWDFGDGTTSTEINPTHIYESGGTYEVTLISLDPTTCNLGDTVKKYITVEEIDHSMYGDTLICDEESVVLTPDVIQPGNEYVWSSNAGFTDTLNTNIQEPQLSVTPVVDSTYYYLSVESDYCQIIDTVLVRLSAIEIDVPQDTFVCLGDTLWLEAADLSGNESVTWDWNPDGSIVGSDSAAAVAIVPTQNGDVSLVAINQDGCQANGSFNVFVDDFSFTSQVIQPQCFDECTGSVSISPQGVGPYNYNWSTGYSGQNNENLCSGDIEVTVTDDYGCSGTEVFSIIQPSDLLIDYSVTDADCNGSPIGGASLTVSGGTPGYEYVWNTGSTDSYISGVSSGEYTVTVYDTNNCDSVINIEISDNSDLSLLMSEPDTLPCYEQCQGVASAYIENGVAPYTYEWSTGQNSEEITGLCADTYVFSVTDAENCTRVDSVTIEQPDELSVAIGLSQGIDCYGQTASVGAQPYGGTPEYEIIWENGSSSMFRDNLVAGTYAATVTDANGCEAVNQITVTDVAPFYFDSLMQNTVCGNVCNGVAELYPEGGTPPFTYTWESGNTDSVRTDLCEGTYPVTITDANGCVYITEMIIENDSLYPSLDAYADENRLLVGQSTGVHAESGSGTSFVWRPGDYLSDSTIAHPIATPQESITYEVMVMDENGCMNIDTVEIIVGDVFCDEPYIYVPNAFSPNNDGENDVLFVHTNMADEVYFVVYDRWGKEVFITNDITQGWDGTYNGEILDPAVFVYYLRVRCFNEEVFEKKGNVSLIR